MASQRETYEGLLKKASAARLDTKKVTYRRNSNRYKNAITKLTTLLQGTTPLKGERKYEAIKELKTLGAILSEEDEKDTSIKDAKKAIRVIENKLGIEPLEFQARSHFQGANRFEDDRHQEKSTATTRPEIQSSDAVPGKTKAIQMKALGPFKHQHFIAFLKEIKSIISDEQEDFSDEVFNWFPDGKDTRAILELKEAIAIHEIENKQMRGFISSLKEGLSDGKFNKISVKGEMQSQKDAQNLMCDMQKLVDGVKRLREENISLAQQNRDMKADILTIKNNMDKLGNEKDELVLRLSEIARAQLTDNNTGIADLVDPNTPTKLSEQYLEIYDNEWTKAYETMQNESKMKEEQICLELLNILQNAESECREIAKEQYEQLCSRCTSPAGPGIRMEKKLPASSAIVKYQIKCVEVCWYMSLQTPPVILDKLPEEGQEFDRDKYREYTKSGKLIEFVTWPTLLLHKDGPVLCKGVAQGISRLS